MPKAKILLLMQFILFSALPIFSQTVDTAWVRRYNGPGNDYDAANALAVDTSGNVYVTGISFGIGTAYDYATIKYAPNGDILWVRRYNGPGNFEDWAYALAVDGSGNVYVTGFSTGIGTSWDYATIKYAPNGDTLWVRRYNGPGNSSDAAYSLATDDSGNVYVAGYSYDSVTSFDYATIKYGPNGETLWVRRYNGPANGDDYPGGYIVESPITIYSLGSLAVDSVGNVYVTGSSWNGTSYDYATIKYSPDGDTLWVRRYDSPGNAYDEARALAVDVNGNVYVTGVSYDSVTSYDYATLKYSPSGDTLWVRRYNGPGNFRDLARTLAVDGSGNVYVTGYSVDSMPSFVEYPAYATLKYSSTGDTLWVRRYTGPWGTGDPTALAVDGSGNVYVTGISDGDLLDYATVKYSPSGDTLWVRRYDGPGAGSMELAVAIAVDGNSNAYVTGAGDVNGGDYLTVKYSSYYATPIRQDTLAIIAYSPVNLVVTDPKQDSIGLDTTGTRPDTIFNTILAGSTYDTTQDVSVPPDGEKDIVVTIPKPYVGEYKIRVVPKGTGHYSLGIRIDGSDRVYLANNQVVPETSTTFEYSVLTTLRGDVNKDAKRNLTDIIYLVNYVFKGGLAPNPVELGNVNCSSGAPNLTDIVYLVNYVFKGGKPPCS